jgi:hypothetical protein
MQSELVAPFGTEPDPASTMTNVKISTITSRSSSDSMQKWEDGQKKGQFSKKYQRQREVHQTGRDLLLKVAVWS